MRDRGKLHWAWIVLIICFLDLYVNYSVRLGYGVILPEMMRGLGLSRTAGGTVYNAYLFTYIVLTPVTGYLTDRLGARRVITVCALILGAGALMMGASDGLGSACLAYGLAGLGATGMWAPVITVVQRWFAPDRRGMALGILSTGYGLGFATLGAVFPLITAHFSWRFAWYFLGAGALVLVVGNGLLLRSSPESSGTVPWGQRLAADGSVPPGPPVPRLDHLFRIFRERSFWLIGLSYFCIAHALYGVTTFMVDYGEGEIGMPLDTASLLATVHGLAQIAGVLIILPLSDVFGRKRTITASNLCLTLAILGILLAEHSWLLLFCFVGFMALFYGATFPVYGACAGDYFPRQFMGSVIGCWTFLFGVGAMTMHWVGGSLRDATGSYHHTFSVAVAMAALAFVLILLAPSVRPSDT
jgi:sugar phosphate permease